VTEQFDGVLQVLTTTRLRRAQNDQKSVTVALFFQTPDHFFDVLGVSMLGVIDAWCVKKDVGSQIGLISPSRNKPLKLISF